MNGCIYRELSGSQDIAKLHFYYQNMTTLKRDSLRDLFKLTTLKFMNCDVRTIKEGAFVNLPNLEYFAIEGTSINEISNYFISSNNLNKIVLSNNYIEFIRRFAFSNATNLLEFYANNNNMQYFNGEWLSEAKKLELLSISGNKIRFIPRRCLYENKKLIEIYLNKNDISVIEEEAFDGLNSLQYLDLSFNRIKILNRNILPTSDGLHLKSFDISANVLNYLPDNLLNDITIETIRLYGNPWKCTCLKRFEILAKSKNVTIDTYYYCRDIPICVSSNETNCLEEYDKESSTHFYYELIDLREKLEQNSCVRFN